MRNLLGLFCVMRFQLPERLFDVMRRQIDFPAARIRRLRLANERREAFPRAADDFRHDEPRNHAAVAIRKVAEEMVRTHLRAVDRADASHRFLHESVTALGNLRPAARRRHNVRRVPPAAGIVYDDLARMFLEHISGQKPHHVIALDEMAFLVDEETAVEIAVPRNPHIRVRFLHFFNRGRAIFLEHRIRHAMRKRPVRPHMHFHKLKRQVLGERLERDRRAAVSRIDDNFKRLHRGRIAICQNMRHIIVRDIFFGNGASARRLFEISGKGQRLDIFQTGIFANRHAAFADQFQSVVIRRIVARRHHDAAGQTVIKCREIHHFRAAKSDVQDVRAAVHQPLRDRRRDSLRRKTHVPPERDASRMI